MLIIGMTDTHTGQRKNIEMNISWDGPSIWRDDDFACDCNRHKFFYPDEDFEHPCGDDRFLITYIRCDSEIVYDGDDK